MGEQGKAMMGTATASGEDRARVAAENAVQSPLLEGVDLSGARGILVNITASRALRLKETRIATETIRNFAAEDATIILGTVYDDTLGDDLRVTVVATGLGRHRKPTLVHDAAAAPVIRTGTDNMPIAVGGSGGLGGQPSALLGAQPAVPGVPSIDYSKLDAPAVWRDPRSQAAARVDALQESGMDRLDIPAFLRKQAD
jgi:cell division protein FtsZ